MRKPYKKIDDKTRRHLEEGKTYIKKYLKNKICLFS